MKLGLAINGLLVYLANTYTTRSVITKKRFWFKVASTEQPVRIEPTIQ